jgi:hypothetical protein
VDDSVSTRISSIKTQANSLDQQLSQQNILYTGGQLHEATHDKDVRVASFTIQQTGSIPATGVNSAKLASVSTEINSIADNVKVSQNEIRHQNSIVRLLIGGNSQAALSLEQQATRYDEQISALRQVTTQSDIDPQVKTMLDDQIQTLQQERDRITELATAELRDRGIFGGILGSRT